MFFTSCICVWYEWWEVMHLVGWSANWCVQQEPFTPLCGHVCAYVPHKKADPFLHHLCAGKESTVYQYSNDLWDRVQAFIICIYSNHFKVSIFISFVDQNRFLLFESKDFLTHQPFWKDIFWFFLKCKLFAFLCEMFEIVVTYVHEVLSKAKEAGFEFQKFCRW